MTTSKLPILSRCGSESVVNDPVPTTGRLRYAALALYTRGDDTQAVVDADTAPQAVISLCHRDEPGNDRGGAVLRLRTPTVTETMDLYVIARLDIGDAAADVYSSEIYSHRAADGAFCGRTTTSWSRSLQLEPGTSANLDGLDRTLAAAGYFRTSGWRVRATASGAVRYFADATTARRRALDDASKPCMV